MIFRENKETWFMDEEQEPEVNMAAANFEFLFQLAENENQHMAQATLKKLRLMIQKDSLLQNSVDRERHLTPEEYRRFLAAAEDAPMYPLALAYHVKAVLLAETNKTLAIAHLNLQSIFTLLKAHHAHLREAAPFIEADSADWMPHFEQNARKIFEAQYAYHRNLQEMTQSMYKRGDIPTLDLEISMPDQTIQELIDNTPEEFASLRALGQGLLAKLTAH